MNDMEEIIAAFVDDERVDSESLARALSKPEGREYLLDLLALRELVVDRVNEATQPASAAPAHASRRWLAAAAAILVAAGLTGFGIGRVVTLRETPQTIAAPPSAAPASLEPATVELLTPPAPTRVIRLEVGKDWQERSGGE